MSRKFFLGMAVTIALLVAGAGVFHAQQAPPPAPPRPRVAPELPELPEPPEAPEAPEIFLLNDGSVHLGVTLGDVTTGKAQELKLPAVAGALVNSVQKNSAAAKAGIEVGDAIIEFDGIRVRSSAELRRLIRETPAGRTVEMKIVRDGKTRVLSAKLEASDNHFNFNYNFKTPAPKFFTEILPYAGAHRATLGISGDDLTPQLAQYFGVKQGKGVLIAEVTKGGAADKAGLKAGDVIVQVDGKSISGVEELRATLNDNFTGDTRKVSLTIVRDHHEQTINADLTRSPTWEKHTSSTAGSTRNLALAQIRAQAGQQRALAAEMRVQADRQRAIVRAEVLKQSQQVHEEWQRQMRDQMLLLKDQLKQMQNFHVALHQDGEI
jgi:predicted metalloprotease with PDZ domain